MYIYQKNIKNIFVLSPFETTTTSNAAIAYYKRTNIMSITIALIYVFVILIIPSLSCKNSFI